MATEEKPEENSCRMAWQMSSEAILGVASSAGFFLSKTGIKALLCWYLHKTAHMSGVWRGLLWGSCSPGENRNRTVCVYMVLLIGSPFLLDVLVFWGWGGMLGLHSPTAIGHMSSAARRPLSKAAGSPHCALSPTCSTKQGLKYCAQRETRHCSVTSRGRANGGNVHRPLSVLCNSIKLLDGKLGNSAWIYSALSLLCYSLLPAPGWNKCWTSSWQSLKYICFYLFKNSNWELMLSRIRKALFLGFV